MSDYFDRIERQLVARVEACARPARRTRWSWPMGSPAGLLVPFVAAVVVIAVAAVFLTAGTRRGPSPSPSASGSTITFTASPAAPDSALGPAVRESAAVLRLRLHAVSPQLRVTQAGDQIVVTGASKATEARILELAAPGLLSFFDWEANVLTPSGRPVAGQLTPANATALTISQGLAAAPPGAPQAGALSLYDAVSLAARQPAAPASSRLSRPYPQYYLFSRTLGPHACAEAARAAGTAPGADGRCLLAGPDTTLATLRSSLPHGVSLSDGSLRVVPPGTLVLEASGPDAMEPVELSSPAARFFVLRDQRMLRNAELTSPRPSTDMSGSPDLTFGFTPNGRRAFARITARIARRGSQVSSGASVLDQHFAVTLDGRLLTVPSIDYKTYPEGIAAGDGADITGGFTTHSARDLALMLRDGPLLAILTPAG